MNPNSQSPIQGDFDQDPFASIISRGIRPAETTQEQPQDPQAQMQMLKDQQDPNKNQLLPGANPGNSKYLLGAIQQIQGFIANSTERDEIAIGRSLIQLLTRLVSKDQEKMNAQLTSANQPTPPQQTMQQAPQGPTPMGQPAPQEMSQTPIGGPQG